MIARRPPQSTAIAALALLSLLFSGLQTQAVYLPGDVNNDGQTDFADTRAGLQISGGVSVSTNIGGDLTDDGQVGLPEALHVLRQVYAPQCPADALYVATSGSPGAQGTFHDPLDSWLSARDRIRQLKYDNSLPADGITVCIRGGVYEMRQALGLEAGDSGTDQAPIVYQAYPGETVIITGGATLAPDGFTPVDASDAVWSRLDETARAHILQIDLGANGITDYGQMVQRGYDTHDAHSPMELSIDHQIMELARWPNRGQSDTENPDAPAIVSGDLAPDVTGPYDFIGTDAQGNADDGYPNYRRQGLVGDVQYYLYHCTWQDGGARYWFISAYDPQSNPNCWTTGEWADHSAWEKAGEETIPPLEPFREATGIATVNNRPEDFKEHGFVRVPQVLDEFSFRFPGNRYQRWTQADDIWVQGLLGKYWADDTLAATLSGDTLLLASPPSYPLALKMPFFVLNLLEEIDKPGEYYIDRTTGTLYVYPPAAFDEIRVSLLDDAIIRGDGVQHVRFSGLTLEMSRGDLVHIENATGVVLDHLVLRNNGGIGVRLEGADNQLAYCRITGSGGAGVELDGGSRADLTAANNQVANSEIDHFARWDRTYRPAVKLKGVGQRVVHNYIHDAPHFGIYFYGNDHLIEYNRLERVTLESNDAGAIYTGRDWGYRGTLIRYNYFKDIDSVFGGSHAVYFDDGASGSTVFGNIFHIVNGYAVLSGGGRDNRVTNNVIVGAERGAMSSDRRVGVKINNIFYGTWPHNWNLLGRLHVSYYDGAPMDYQSAPWVAAYPALAAIPDDFNALVGSDWLEPEGCVFANNITWQTERLLVDGTWGGGGASDFFAQTAPNLDDQDPLFVDEAGGNLNLQPASPAFGLPGFVAIPFDDIGIVAELQTRHR